MNRIGILDGYGDYGAYRRKAKKHKKRKGGRHTKQQVKFAKAARACSRRRSGKFHACMAKTLKKKRGRR